MYGWTSKDITLVSGPVHNPNLELENMCIMVWNSKSADLLHQVFQVNLNDAV